MTASQGLPTPLVSKITQLFFSKSCVPLVDKHTPVIQQNLTSQVGTHKYGVHFRLRLCWHTIQQSRLFYITRKGLVNAVSRTFYPQVSSGFL